MPAADAAVDPGQHHLAALFVVQVDARFQAAERMRHFAHDAVDQLVEIEDGSDFLRSFLHALQVLDQIGGESPRGRFDTGEDWELQPYDRPGLSPLTLTDV